MQMTPARRAIDKIYKRRDRYDIPDWQREKVWGSQQKRLLIDTILKGWKLPKFYFLKLSEDPDEFEVVDGQQRLAAIFEFFDDELELSKTSAAQFGGARYSELPQAQQDAFDDFEIQYDVIEHAQDHEVKEFFQRLQAGLPLTASEKLNSLHSNLRGFARKLARHDFFRSKVALADKRYAHFDIASKVAAIEVDGLDAGLRYDDLKETFLSQASFSSRSQVAKRLREGFDYLDRVFPQKSAILRHRTIVQSFATLALSLVSHGKASGYEPKLHAFFQAFMNDLSKQVELGPAATDQDYLAFQRTVNANVRSGARIRHDILLRKLLMFDPRVADLLHPTAVAESGIAQSIRQIAEAVALKVHDVNAVYSSKHGTDLFKVTNKTAMALTRIAKPITNYDQYKTLIENLYFLFHEGAGTRLTPAQKPQSFTDVSLLRTGLQHDLDHGSRTKARKKMKTIGDTFKRYAGVPSPAGLDPARFPIAHANLLAALHRDLIALKL